MKITIYELLGMIKDGKAPKRIKYEDIILKYDLEGQDYRIYQNGYLFTKLFERPNCKFLNDEVEIIEENKTKSLTKKDIETLGYACGEIQKCFTNGWTKSLENKPLEEHKIPEKLEIEQDTPNSNFYIRDEYGTKCALTKHSKIIADKINEILDYLEVNND